MPICLALFSVAAFANDLKIAHVNSQEIMSLMPEIGNYEKEIANFTEESRKYLETMEAEVNAEMQKYEAEKATMSESIRKIKEAELQDRINRLRTYYQTVEQDVAKKQQELLAPIQEKVQNAINEVALKNGVTYVFDEQVMVYKAPKAFDLTPLVKKQLGILQ